MNLLRRAAIPVSLLLLAAAIWLGLLRREPPASWLRVEAPPHAIASQILPVRVLLDAPEDTLVGVDLHWATTRREPRGLLSTSPRQRVDGGESTHTFELPVAVPDDLGHVSAILFLSASGRWEDRTAAAATPLIPIRTSGVLEPLEPIPAYDLPRAEGSTVTASPLLRNTIAVLWVLSGISLWRLGVRGPAGWLALACLAAAVWELSNVEEALSGTVRAAALEHRLYYERFWLQRSLTFAIVAATAASIVWALRRSRVGTTDLVRAALCLYSGISLASLVSVHGTDRFMGSPIFSVPFAQVAKLAIAIAILLLARGSASSPPAAERRGRHGRRLPRRAG